LISGSSDGNIKIWDLPTFNCQTTWTDAHERHTFVRAPSVFSGQSESTVTTYGVTQVRASPGFIYSCGSDGRVVQTAFGK